MIKSIVMHDIDIDSIAPMERWYWQKHAPEICRRFGPWLERHGSYFPVDASRDARTFGFYNWRVTEGIWRDIPKSGPQGDLAFSVPPVWPQVATCFVPAQPDNDLLGSDIQPNEKEILRWYVLFKNPDGVSLKEGDKWFLNDFVPQALKQEGLFRFFSSRIIQEPMSLPGTWPVEAKPPHDTVNVGWHRVIEFWYEFFQVGVSQLLKIPFNTPFRNGLPRANFPL